MRTGVKTRYFEISMTARKYAQECILDPAIYRIEITDLLS